jgi:hypothetical protein
VCVCVCVCFADTGVTELSFVSTCDVTMQPVIASESVAKLKPLSKIARVHIVVLATCGMGTYPLHVVFSILSFG